MKKHSVRNLTRDHDMTSQVSETGQFSLTVRPKPLWDQKVAKIAKAGERLAEELQEKGHSFKVEILAPKEMVEQTSVPLSAVTLNLDWKIAARLEMIEHAREIITKALFVDSLDSALPTILTAIMEGRGLYEHGIGEFFLLYGKFEQKHSTGGKETRAKMMELIENDMQYMKPYLTRGKTVRDPLPYAARNILAHAGTNPNTLDENGSDLKKSVELLRSWVQ